ncbi:MAG TPA: DUF3054 domain-containing protein [Actinomycetota bacterium]|nr:DUF3054 domain-containing protein [Actinomycetota bacterium]
MTRPRLTDGTTSARVTLVVDCLALALFVLAGMRSHRTASQLEIFARNAVPIGGAWLVVSLVMRTYRPPSLARLVLTWAVAVPSGVVLRTLWTGSPSGDDLLVFGAVAMAFTLAFLGAGRAVAAFVVPRLRAVPWDEAPRAL